MEYNNLNEIRDQWLSGNFSYPEEMMVAGIPYKLRSSSTHEFQDVIIRGAKPYIIYQTSKNYRDDAKEQGMHQWLVFIWGANENSIVRPFDARSVSPNRLHNVVESQERIGDVVIMKLFLPSGAAALKGKVDTGAEISSLHADDIKIMNGTVKFTNKELSGNVITMPIAEQQAVKSADGGVEYRPVVELDVEINGKAVRGVMFNLNDRNQMEYPALVGQNILEKTNFLVDPKQNDPEAEKLVRMEDEWLDDDETITEDMLKALDKEFEGIEPVVLESSDNNEKLEAVYKTLQEANISFADFIRFVRTDARKVLEDIEY